MRRPLKPFVTEYRGSSRRTAAPADSTAFETDRPAPKPFDVMSRHEPEDSFEAAMRAADALFSIPSAPKPPDNGAPPPTDLMQPGENEPPREPAGPEKASGRILRVIDEEPAPEYAALEAERAPKRRGRKPGSKNKPKANAIIALVDEPHEVPIAHVAPPPVASRAAPVPAALRVPAISDDLGPTLSTPAKAEAPHGEKRFPWVRDRLKPGEDWKRRRLPRICW